MADFEAYFNERALRHLATKRNISSLDAPILEDAADAFATARATVKRLSEENEKLRAVVREMKSLLAETVDEDG